MINPRKQLRREQQVAKRKHDISGTGSYIFQNNTCGDFYLPRPTTQNVRIVAHGKTFIGDSYYFGLVKTGELKLVKEVDEHKETEQQFVFKNKTRDDLHLPTPTSEGQSIIAPGGTFVGDSIYFPFLKTGQLMLVKEVSKDMDDKLITEQPPLITDEGQVEFVKQDDKITEIKKKDQDKKKINENPLDGVRLLLD